MSLIFNDLDDKPCSFLVSYLLHNHVDYAVELGLAGIPLPESRNHPEIHFFDIVRQTNTIIFLVDKLFSGRLLPSST